MVEGESDLETSDDESSEQEVANLCLVAKEEELDKVIDEPNSFDELQNIFDELYEESKKIGLKNSMLKKLDASITHELDKLKLHASD